MILLLALVLEELPCSGVDRFDLLLTGSSGMVGRDLIAFDVAAAMMLAAVSSIKLLSSPSNTLWRRAALSIGSAH